MPPRGRRAVALVAILFVGGSAAAQLPAPALRAQLLGQGSQPATLPPVALQPELPVPPAPPPDPSIAPPYRAPTVLQVDTGGKPFAGWDDGFYLRSADRQFGLRITGQIQADYRWYANPDDRNDIGGFVIRRARFGLEAVLFGHYEFRFLPDFGQGQTRLQDAFLNIRYWDEAQFTAGKFKQPFSYEQLIQDRYTPLMERSLIDQLVPARDVGVMIHGQNLL